MMDKITQWTIQLTTGKPLDPEPKTPEEIEEAAVLKARIERKSIGSETLQRWVIQLALGAPLDPEPKTTEELKEIESIKEYFEYLRRTGGQMKLYDF